MLIRAVVAITILPLAACGGSDTLGAAPSSSSSSSPSAQGADAADRCAEFAQPVLVVQAGDGGTLVTAKRTTVQRVRQWQESRFESGRGPDLKDKALYDLPSSQEMTVCIFDGDFRPPVPAPVGASLPTFDRAVALVRADDSAQLQLLTQKEKLPAAGPE